MVADVLSRLVKQGDMVDDLEAVLPFVLEDQDVFPVQIQKMKEKHAKSLRKKMRQNPKDYTKIDRKLEEKKL